MEKKLIKPNVDDWTTKMTQKQIDYITRVRISNYKDKFYKCLDEMHI